MRMIVAKWARGAVQDEKRLETVVGGGEGQVQGNQLVK